MGPQCHIFATALLIAAVAIPLVSNQLMAAGGAFVVDDAFIGKPGECKVESWASFASNHDFLAVTSPACVINLGIPVEAGATLVRTRSDGVWSTGAGPKAKINIVPLADTGFGLGLSGATLWNLNTGQNVGGNINLPLTIQASKDVRTLIGEVFGLAGSRQEVRSVTEPRAQLGLRWTPAEAVDIDLIYGRDIAGENANWLTLGVNLRF